MGFGKGQALYPAIAADYDFVIMKTALQKIFTREFPVILCQIWGRRYKNIFGKDLRITPRNVFVCRNGLVEAYRRESPDGHGIS